MSDAALFLRKRKDKERRSRVPSRSIGGGPSTSTQNAPLASTSTTSSKPSSSIPNATNVKVEPKTENGINPNITEIKIFSAGSDGGLRFNFMRLNHEKEIDPIEIINNNNPSTSSSSGPSKLLLNRKKPGPKQPPIYAMNEQGKIIGKFVYDPSNPGKPLLDSEGQPVIERKLDFKQKDGEGIDMSLVGQAPPGSSFGLENNERENKIGQAPGKRKMKKGTKEVFHQDIEIMRLRREEALPWVLENSNLSSSDQKQNIPEHWVGRMQEPSALPTVLLVNDGTTEGFEMVPLGRTYRFDPARPFKTLDPDAAIKLFEHQAKHKIHDRWALRPEGSNNIVAPESIVNSVKAERDLEQRAQRMEGRIKLIKGISIDRKPKIERYEDDYVREGRRAERGLEGGIDEELDFDETEHFQDDDDVNTFYRNVEEEDEAKEAEEQQKKEYRLANANVGDKPQIAEDDDNDNDAAEDDLFSGKKKKKLDDEGKKLRKIMKKRREEQGDDDDNMFSDDDDDESDESDTESVNSKTSQNKDKNKDKDKDGKSTTEDQSRPPSRGPGSARGTSSPTGKRPNGPMTGKASTAPPGSGAALLAQRAASRGASPRPSNLGRAGSPLSGRATSPENTSGNNARATSPIMRGNSPVPQSNSRGQSPVARGSSPVTGSGQSTRDVSPVPGGGASGSGKSSKSNSGKRKTTSESPGPSGPSGQTQTASPSASGKRKNSPSDNNGNGNGNNRGTKKSKKSGSNTPTPGPPDLDNIEEFENMITKQEVLNWFKSIKKDYIPMSEAISAFRNRIMQVGKNRELNQKLFLGWMKMLADQEDKMLRLKEEYR
ncbi:uncharacterized protein L201_003025 [Kwoniella dendrophila CBS 6074]|uniref:Transcription initiation factor IIF subunit alpha n=1 Tax=Kwoniella dendrophila CBS 6074 TaxID=1295534 RepID=A0AAX4JRU5_9TREE